jgi:hypothetical protein
MDEDINSFLLFCGAKMASANPNLQPGIELYHNRGVLLSPIIAGFLSTHNNKEEAFNWVSPFISYNNVISELATTMSADCFSQNATVSNKGLARIYCPVVM